MRIEASSPCRLSLAGGGTDLPSFYEKYDGLCINMAINLRQIVVLSEKEKLLPNDNPKLIAEFTRYFPEDMQKVRHTFKGEIESGLGSSAALAVALTASHPNFNRDVTPYKYWIALQAWEIEVNDLGLYGGKQDQYAAAFGGLNTFHFKKDGTVDIKSWDKDTGDWLSSNILLFYTGEKRGSVNPQERLRELSSEKVDQLHRILELAGLAGECLSAKNIHGLTSILRESWEMKKALNKVSNPKIDMIYETAITNGALAGKLMGSGGGGYMFFLVQPKNQSKVKDALAKVDGVKWTDFKIDYNGVETRIINE